MVSYKTIIIGGCAVGGDVLEWIDPFYQKRIAETENKIKVILLDLKLAGGWIANFDATYPDIKNLKASTRIGGISLVGSGKMQRQAKVNELKELRAKLKKEKLLLAEYKQQLRGDDCG